MGPCTGSSEGVGVVFVLGAYSSTICLLQWVVLQNNSGAFID